MRGAFPRVEDRVGAGTVAILAVNRDGANVDGRIDGPHLVVEGLKGVRVGIRIPLHAGKTAAADAVLIGLPIAVAFIADLPIFEAVRRRMGGPEKIEAIILGQRRGTAERRPVAHGLPVAPLGVCAEHQRARRIAIVIGDPRRGLLGGATPVVHNHVGLRPRRGGDAREAGRAIQEGRSVQDVLGGGPVVVIRIVSSREADHGFSHGGKLSSGHCVLEIRIPRGDVQPVKAGVDGAHHVLRVGRERDLTRCWVCDEGDVVEIPRPGLSGSVLDISSVPKVVPATPVPVTPRSESAMVTCCHWFTWAAVTESLTGGSATPELL